MILHLKCGNNGITGIAEKHHNTIAHKFIDKTAMFLRTVIFCAEWNLMYE